MDEANREQAGPSSYRCHFPGCTQAFLSPVDCIHHQRFHATTAGFRFVCPLPTCHSTFENFQSVSSHLSQHRGKRCVLGGSSPCSYCEKKFATIGEICVHIKKDHLSKGETVSCPFPGCGREKTFQKEKPFGTHLALYHPGWRHDSTGLGTEDCVLGEGAQLPVTVTTRGEHEEYEEMDVDSDHGDPVSSSDSDQDSDGEPDGNDCDYDSTVAYIANFYAMLEGKHVVPSSTVDAIANRLAFVSEILSNRLQEQLSNSLKLAGLADEVIADIILSVTSTDPFYNTHHKTALGNCLLSTHLRKEYYKKNFKYIEPMEINLKKDASDREETIQYVDVRETVKVLLEDTSVQTQVDNSFVSNMPDGSILSNYTSGSVFRLSDCPQKRIDLMFFMDAFSCVNPLGSAKKKHKMNGMYMVLGNLEPHNRSYLKSMRLVLMFEEKLLKLSEKKFYKCFQKVMMDVKELEDNGVLYKGEMVPVRLQFLQGDSLGQHTAGGFVENFTGHYFCRFCDLPSAVFKADALQDEPLFRMGEWRTHTSFSEDLQKKTIDNLETYRGVKRASPFNELQFFKACDPRLSPCLAHDLFIGGVVDCDTASIISHFVVKKKFTYEEMKNRIQRFHYLGNDSRNKPTDINNEGKKLGGHAIQNWTLFRMLPLIIGDKIDPQDEVWKLYLLLKSICELVCAPALTVNQVETMRTLIVEYMMKRKILKKKYKPKYHFLMHYPDLFLKFGALIYHWTLGFEHFHQYFKTVARACKNFKNLALTLASKFQIYQAYQSMGNLYPSDPVFKNTYPFVLETHDEEMKNFLKDFYFSPNAVEVNSVRKSEILYKKDMWLLLSKDSNANIFIGKIEVIICDEADCKFVLLKRKASPWTDYGLYCIEEDAGTRCMVSFGSLENPCPHPVYKFKDFDCFSLKHVFVDSLQS